MAKVIDLTCKAALNMVTACHSAEYEPAIKVFAYDPGFRQSSFGPQNSADNGAKPVAKAVMPLITL